MYYTASNGAKSSVETLFANPKISIRPYVEDGKLGFQRDYLMCEKFTREKKRARDLFVKRNRGIPIKTKKNANDKHRDRDGCRRTRSRKKRGGKSRGARRKKRIAVYSTQIKQWFQTRKNIVLFANVPEREN